MPPQCRNRPGPDENRPLLGRITSQVAWMFMLCGFVSIGGCTLAERQAELQIRIERSRRAELMAALARLDGPEHQYPALLLGMHAARPDLRTGTFDSPTWQGLADAVASMVPSRALFPQHGTWRGAAAFSTDGQRVAFQERDDSVCILDLNSGQELQRLHGLESTVDILAFSPDGSQVAGSDRNRVLISNVNTGRRDDRLRDRIVASVVLVFSPDGNRILTDAAVDRARIYDVRTGRTLAELALGGASAQVHSAAFSPDGRRVLTGHHDGSAALWESTTGRLLFRMDGEHREHAHVVGTAFSPNGKNMATASATAIFLRNAETGKPHHVVTTPYGAGPVSLVFSGDGKWLLAADQIGGLLRVIETEFGTIRRTISVYEGPRGNPKISSREELRSAVFSDDGDTLLTASSHIRRWELRSGQKPSLPQGAHLPPVIQIVGSTDGQQFLSVSKDGTMVQWDARTGKHLRTLQKSSAPADSATSAHRADRVAIGHRVLAFGPGGRWLLHASSTETERALVEGIVEVWEAGKRQRTLVWTQERNPEALWGHPDIRAAFSGDGKYIATSSLDSKARLWDASSGQPMHVLENTGHISVMAFSPDSRLLLTGNEYGPAKLWDVKTGALVHTVGIGVQHQMLWSLAFSPDGTQFATSGSHSGTSLWDVKTGKLVRALENVFAPVTLRYSSSGTHLLTADRSSVEVWDLATRNRVYLFHALPDVHGAAYAPDGKHVVVLSIGRGGDIRTHSFLPSQANLYAQGCRLIREGPGKHKPDAAADEIEYVAADAKELRELLADCPAE